MRTTPGNAFTVVPDTVQHRSLNGLHSKGLVEPGLMVKSEFYLGSPQHRWTSSLHWTRSHPNGPLWENIHFTQTWILYYINSLLHYLSCLTGTVWKWQQQMELLTALCLVVFVQIVNLWRKNKQTDLATTVYFMCIWAHKWIQDLRRAKGINICYCWKVTVDMLVIVEACVDFINANCLSTFWPWQQGVKA